MKQTITKEQLIELANNLYFDIDDHQVKELIKEFDSVFAGLELLDEMNLEGYEPKNYGVNTSIHTLREDHPINANRDQVLKNVDQFENEMVVVKHG